MNELITVKDDGIGFPERKMTVKEVADVLGVTPEAIKKHVRELFPESIKNGIQTEVTEAQMTEIKRRMIPTTQVVAAVTSLDIEEMTLKVIQYHQAEAARLRAENAIMAPKAAFYDQVADAKNAIDMRSAAAALNITGLGRNNLFEKLRNLEILDNENLPYRRFQDSGYFRVIITRYTDQYGETHANTKTLVYPKGLDFIRKAVSK